MPIRFWNPAQPNNPADPNDSFGHSLGQGCNIEGAVAVTGAVQLGLRTGLRFGYPARFNGPAGADAYGRLVDTETYGSGTNELANPDLYARGSLVQGNVVERETRTSPPERSSAFLFTFGFSSPTSFGSGLFSVSASSTVLIGSTQIAETASAFPWASGLAR